MGRHIKALTAEGAEIREVLPGTALMQYHSQSWCSLFPEAVR